MQTNEIFTVKGVEFKFIKASSKNGGETHVWALNMETKKQTQVAIENIDTDIESLAYKMGVPAAEVEMFARSIANSIEQDKLSEAYTQVMSKDEQCDVIQAYSSHAVRKINEFYTSYMTNQHFRELFQDMVYSGIKYGRVC